MRKINEVRVTLQGVATDIPVYFDKRNGMFSARIGRGDEVKSDRYAAVESEIMNQAAAINGIRLKPAILLECGYNSVYATKVRLVGDQIFPKTKDREPFYLSYERAAVIEKNRVVSAIDSRVERSHRSERAKTFHYSPVAVKKAQRVAEISKMLDMLTWHFHDAVKAALGERKVETRGPTPPPLRTAASLAKLNPDKMLKTLLTAAMKDPVKYTKDRPDYEDDDD